MNSLSGDIQARKVKAPDWFTSQFPRSTLRFTFSIPIHAGLSVSALLVLLSTCSALTAQVPEFTELSAFGQPNANHAKPERAASMLAGSVPTTNPPASSDAKDNAVPVASGAKGASETKVNNAIDSLDDKHRLAIGDRLSFRIEEDLEDPKPLVVTDSGDLEVPYIGRFPAENKTSKQLAREVKAALEKDYYYQATVIIAVDQMAKSRGKVYLVGPVRIPGPQEIPSDEILTLSKAIMRAGGFNDFADRHNVKVTRKGHSGGRDTKTFVVDVGQIFDKGKVDLDLLLEPGDLILIPERLVRF